MLLNNNISLQHLRHHLKSKQETESQPTVHLKNDLKPQIIILPSQPTTIKPQKTGVEFQPNNLQPQRTIPPSKPNNHQAQRTIHHLELTTIKPKKLSHPFSN
jgi:hypothetical protein